MRDREEEEQMTTTSIPSLEEAYEGEGQIFANTTTNTVWLYYDDGWHDTYCPIQDYIR